jgi:hypothetical protein
MKLNEDKSKKAFTELLEKFKMSAFQHQRPDIFTASGIAEPNNCFTLN